MNQETLRVFLREQMEMCDSAAKSLAERGDDPRHMKDWFEGRRDMCNIILQKLVN